MEYFKTCHAIVGPLISIKLNPNLKSTSLRADPILYWYSLRFFFKKNSTSLSRLSFLGRRGRCDGCMVAYLSNSKLITPGPSDITHVGIMHFQNNLIFYATHTPIENNNKNYNTFHFIKS